jgi:hypothetical protein
LPGVNFNKGKSVRQLKHFPIHVAPGGTVAFVPGRAQSGGNILMLKLNITNTKGKRRSFNLVSASNSQRPNEMQTQELEQINRRLPSHILSELSARGLTIPPRESGLVLSRLKTTGVDISVSE